MQKGIAASTCVKVDPTYVFFNDYLLYNITAISPPLSSHNPPTTDDSRPANLVGLGEEIIQDVNVGRDTPFDDQWGIEQGAGKDF